MRFLVRLSVLILGLLQFGCINYQDVAFVSVDSLSVKNISFSGVDLGVTVTLENPNNYTIKIMSADIDLAIAGNHIGKVIIPEKLVLDKKSKKQQTFVVFTELSAISNNLLPSILALMGSKTIHVKASGEFKAKAFAVGKKFLVNFEDDIEIEGGKNS